MNSLFKDCLTQTQLKIRRRTVSSKLAAKTKQIISLLVFPAALNRGCIQDFSKERDRKLLNHQAPSRLNKSKYAQKSPVYESPC